MASRLGNNFLISIVYGDCLVVLSLPAMINEPLNELRDQALDSICSRWSQSEVSKWVLRQYHTTSAQPTSTTLWSTPWPWPAFRTVSPSETTLFPRDLIHDDSRYDTSTVQNSSVHPFPYSPSVGMFSCSRDERKLVVQFYGITALFHPCYLYCRITTQSYIYTTH